MGPHTRAMYSSDALLGGFHDVSYAYRFGPPSHDVVAATLYGTEGEIVSEAFWCPGSRTPPAGGTRGRCGPERGDSATIAMK